jgi:hypothetical protein
MYLRLIYNGKVLDEHDTLDHHFPSFSSCEILHCAISPCISPPVTQVSLWREDHVAFLLFVDIYIYIYIYPYDRITYRSKYNIGRDLID